MRRVIPFSILDLVPVILGETPREALPKSLDLAQHAERFGYTRYWVAEHHNMTAIASAATSVVIGYLAGGTKTIRLGSGGVMLPNHSPLVIAEQFGTLESIYPGRIDLGLGRAPGTDQRTLHALRRDPRRADDFPQDVLELQALLAAVKPGQAVRAVPGAGTEVPLWTPDRVCSALNSPRHSGCLMPLLHTSRPAPCLKLSIFIGERSSLRNNLIVPM